MPGLLHILNGESTAGTLRHSSMPGTFVPYADALHDGPVPAGLDDEPLREMRVRFFAGKLGASYEDILSQVRDWDTALAGSSQYDEVVLWFEHDLFDQLLLIRHLDWFARHDDTCSSLRLICIGQFPGVEPFHGLGQLSADQLVSLFPGRRPVTAAELELGRRAWAAFTSADPRDVERLLSGDTSALPFLAGALVRHLEEFPALSNGLSRTEREILAQLAPGPLDPAALFRAVLEKEERVYMGDTLFWWRVEALAGSTHPLVTLRVEPRQDQLPTGTVAITDTGREVLAGRADWIEIAGIDRWLGGVHLHSDGSMWRWDGHALRSDPTGAPQG